jgi:hypothetical protein
MTSLTHQPKKYGKRGGMKAAKPKKHSKNHASWELEGTRERQENHHRLHRVLA